MKFSPRIKILTIVMLMLLILFLNFFQKEVKNVFYLISSPIQKVFWQAGGRVSYFFETIYKIKHLKGENEELKVKEQKLIAEIVGLKELKKENETLRQALGLGLEKEFNLKLARTASRDIFQDSILIDKGSVDGISEGMVVITQEKVLVGKISEVYKNFSRAMLISDKKSGLPAKIQEKEISGIIQGEGRFLLSLRLIPQDKEIAPGDIVVSDVSEGNLPGLLIGEVKKIEKSDLEPFQQAEVLPFSNLKKIDYLFIIIW